MAYNRLDNPEVEEEKTRLTGASGYGPFFKTPKALHRGISVAAGATMMLFGYEQGVFGGIIVGEDFLEYFNHPTPEMQGWVTACYDLGCFAGAILTLFVGEKLGRRRMLLLFTVIMASGIMIQTMSRDMYTMVWGRIIAGIGNGGNTATAPVWHVETAHHDAKGMAVVKEMAVNVLGFVLASFITLACSPLMSEAQWRFPLGIQLLFVVVIISLVLILPESPRWLLARKRDAEAKHVMALLNDHDVDEEFEEIRASVKTEQAAQASWAQLFRGGLATRRVILGMMLQTAQQLSGINVLAYYLPVVLNRSVGLPELTARFVAAANAVSFWLTTTSSIFFVDRIGRRPLLMLGAAVMAVAFFGVGAGVGVGSLFPDSHIPGIVATAFIWLYFTTFSSGWISVPWLYPAEVNSLSMRTKGAALATACDWLFNWVVVQSTPPGIDYLGWGYYFIFAVMNAAFVPMVYYFVVETKGRRLEDTDHWFEANRAWLVHKADHSVHNDGGVRGGRGDGGGAADDNEAMMKAFEESELESRASEDDLHAPTDSR